MRAILKSMSLHATSDSVKDIHKGLVSMEEWVQALVDGIEERVTNAFASQQNVIDKVEDRVDEDEQTIGEMQKGTR